MHLPGASPACQTSLGVTSSAAGRPAHPIGRALEWPPAVASWIGCDVGYWPDEVADDGRRDGTAWLEGLGNLNCDYNSGSSLNPGTTPSL